MSLRSKLLSWWSPTYRKVSRIEKYLMEQISHAKTLEDIHRNIFCNATHLPKEESLKTLEDYILMQKAQYDDINASPSQIVGNYGWHEKFPYETFLLYKYGDVREPIFESYSDKTALDFACGPGRMIKRMSKFFTKIDGCDISQRLLNEAKLNNQDSNFYLTNGKDLGQTPKGFYDFVYSTISIQHIACHSIRMNLIESMKEVLKKSGCVVLQMAYNRDFPYVTTEREFFLHDKKIVIKIKSMQANYMEDAVYAQGTNGSFDVGIGEKDLPNLKKDFLKTFGNVEIWFANVDNYFDDFRGESHVKYWANDWIFIYAIKN